MRKISKSKNFWKNKKILLTGFNGFKGSWMTLILNRMGSKVYGYSLNGRKERLNNKILKVEKNCHDFMYGDILDINKLKYFFQKVKPEMLIHMASKSTVKESYEDPYNTFLTNNIGLINVLNLLKKKNIPSLVLTSDKCYENKEKGSFFSENESLNGDDPYSASKACQEIICNCFRKSYNLRLSTARAGNVIGGCDFTNNRIINDLISSIYNKKTALIRNPNSLRPWQHVLDVNLNYLLFLKKMYYNKKLCGPWNFGPKKSYKVQKIINFFYKKRKFKFKFVKSSFKENKFLNLSAEKLKRRLDIKNNFPINKSLLLTFNWYEKYYEKNKIYEFSLKQIDQALYETKFN